MLSIQKRITNYFLKPFINKFNEAFIINGGFTNYNSELPTYIDKGYNINPIVYSLINQMASKTASVPFYIKEVEDKQAKHKLDRLMMSTKGNLSMNQMIKYVKLKADAYTKDDKPFPMERPNATQNWSEFMALYKTFLKCTGNVYIYFLAPEDGMNKGVPNQIYLLPSHLVQIVTKDNVNMLEDESPVKGYMLVYGKSYLEFEAENVVHIKRPNPNFDESGSHLYGVSDLQAGLRNIQSTNEGLDLNIKTLKSGGAFGLIHSKGQNTLTSDQAKSLKDRLLEMDSSSDRLSKIAGVSAEVGFTRLSLTSDELKPFSYFEFDEKTIANCLNWEIMDGSRGDFGGTIQQLRKQRVVDNIQPDLKLLEEAFNNYFLPRFKGYENSEVIFDVMELPEMQSDLKALSEWLQTWLDRGTINRDEVRTALGYTPLGTPEMETYTVLTDVMSLEEAIDNTFNNGTTTN